MSQKLHRSVEKIESQTQYSSSRPGPPGRAKPKYQWVSSTKVCGRGGDSDSAGRPPPHFDPHSSTNSRVKKADGQSTVPRANLESNDVDNASFGQTQLSGTSDASTYKAFVRSPSRYGKGDNQIGSGAVSSQSQSETSDSATTRTPLRGDQSSRASLQFQRSRDFANEMQVDHNSFKRETAVSTSSISSKQQRSTVLEQGKNESPQPPKDDSGDSKSETRSQQPKAKRYVRMNRNSSKPGEIEKSSMSSKQLPNQYKQQSKNENPNLQTKHDLPSKNENLLQPKGNLEISKKETPDIRPKDDLDQCKSQTPYLQPRTKRYIGGQRKLSKPGATVPMPPVSNKQETKRYVEQSNSKTPNLKAGEGFEEFEDENFHRQPMVKRYIQLHHNFIKPEGIVSTSYISGRQQHREDLQKSRKENPKIQAEAEIDTQNNGVSAATVVTSAQDVALAGPEVPVATSSYQQSQISNHLGMPGLHTWTPKMTSTAFQMPVQLPSGNASQVSQPLSVPSLQTYPLQPQVLIHYGNEYDFSPQVSHQLGSQFGSINGVSSSYMYNYLQKPASRRSVKITHPETNEELILETLANRRLDGGSSGPMADQVVQAQPVAYGPSPPMNYSSHVQQNSFPFQSPTSVFLRSSQMPPRNSKLGFNSLDIHDVAGAANTEHGASYPASKQVVIFRGPKKSPVPVRSASNGANQTNKPINALRVESKQEESNYYSKGFFELPTSVAASSIRAVPLGTSSATISLGKGGTDDNGKRIAAIGRLDPTMKELHNLSRKHDFQSQKSPQAETSDFPDDSNMESFEVKSRNNTLPPQKEIKQSDILSRSPLTSALSIPGSSNIEMINLEANHSSVDSCESSIVPSQVCLPGAQAGFSCATVEVPGDLPTEKELIHGVSSRYIGQNVNMNNTVATKDAERCNYAASLIQADGKTEELSEQKGTNLFQQPFLHSSCKDGSVNNLKSMEVNQQTMKDLSVVETYACDKHASSGFVQVGSRDSIDAWDSVAKKSGDAVVRYTPSLSHGKDSMFGFPALDSSAEYLDVGVEALENMAGPSLSESGHKNHEEDDPISNSIIMKEVSFKGKQKKEEILGKADSAVASYDLHTAHKHCDEKLQFSEFSGASGNQANTNPGETFSFSNKENVQANKNIKGKTEPGHWETSELEMSNKFEVDQNVRDAALDDIERSGRKCFSRNFLLTLSKQTEFPASFQMAHDMAEALIIGPKSSFARVVRDNSRPSFVQNMDGSAGSSSVDHHGRIKDGHHRETKSPTLVRFETERNYGSNGEGFNVHPGHGGTCNRNMHGQLSGLYTRGTFTGLLPNPASQRGKRRKGADVHQWQRASVFRKKVNSSPQSPLQEMHKAEKKYELHKVMDAEETKQRQLKAILNKLTPQNFERLFQQVKEVNIDSAITLAGLISQIFDKALMEPTFCEMYATFCYHLAGELPDFLEGHEKITFKRLLLNKCQEEFERGEREQAEADRTDRGGEIMFSEEEREEKMIHARRRMLGNIRLIGELYKKKMLTERIMHECIKKLLRNDQFPEEEDIEALCKLMCTIGEIIDHPKAKQHMDAYFAVMLNLSNNRELSTRLRFMLKDVIDLRKNNWQLRRKVEGPQKIEELHSDAAKERAVASQLIHTPTFSSNKMLSTVSGSQPSTFRSSRKSERAPFHAISSRNHGSACQDVRLENRKFYQHRTLPVPFPHRSTDSNITLGLQGGLRKRMSMRNPTVFYDSRLTDSHTAFEESRKVPADPNGYCSIPEWRPHNNLKWQLMPKWPPNIFMQAPTCDPSNQQGHYVKRGSTSASGSFQRSLINRTMIYSSRPTLSSNATPGKRWSDEHLRGMSTAAVREFYRGGNEDKVFQFVLDLNSPSSYPSMICIWVKDSLERKDRERDLLAGLLVSLTKSKAGVLTTSQLIKGLELVLATLEVTFTDAAKAATFLGQLFGRIVTKNVVFLKDIKRMVQQYGKLAGHPPQDKLGYEVMKIAFETIRSEKGESVLKEMCRRSKVQLDDFRPSRALKG